jgi:hypothetical protein
MTVDNEDVSRALLAIRDDAYLRLADFDDAGIFADYNMLGTPVDKGTYVELAPLEYLGGVGVFAATKVRLVVFGDLSAASPAPL